MPKPVMLQPFFPAWQVPQAIGFLLAAVAVSSHGDAKGTEQESNENSVDITPQNLHIAGRTLQATVQSLNTKEIKIGQEEHKARGAAVPSPAAPATAKIIEEQVKQRTSSFAGRARGRWGEGLPTSQRRPTGGWLCAMRA